MLGPSLHFASLTRESLLLNGKRPSSWILNLDNSAQDSEFTDSLRLIPLVAALQASTSNFPTLVTPCSDSRHQPYCLVSSSYNHAPKSSDEPQSSLEPCVPNNNSRSCKLQPTPHPPAPLLHTSLDHNPPLAHTTIIIHSHTETHILYRSQNLR